jgi:hypothetical protein
MCPRCNGYTYIDETHAQTCAICGWRDNRGDTGTPGASRSSLSEVPSRGEIVRRKNKKRAARKRQGAKT